VALERVRIDGVRCINQADLRLEPYRNYIFGPNGAGKTSVLEAIYLLSRGRSFRTRQSKRLIQRGQASLTVLGDAAIDGVSRRLALQLSRAGLETRLDGTAGVGIAELARALPAHVIDPNIHALIEGGPSRRRRFLDWGVFHVEPSFLGAWRRFRRCLGQRNAALKSGAEIEPWSRALAEAGEAVHAARQAYFERLATVVSAVGDSLTDGRLTVSYRRGWSRDTTLAEALTASQNRDRVALTTQVGPHRADLSVALDEQAVREEASRGQQKLVAAALVLSQVRVFAEVTGQGGVLLVDDPAAELDTQSFERLSSALDAVPAQLVLTGLSAGVLPPSPGAAVFHVERGSVRAMV
jgi:DNA replication and repair protein RecF